MSSPRLKICGLTRAQDLALAGALGFDLCGVIFAPSLRRLSIEQAARLLRSASKSMRRVGVFVNPEYDLVERAVRDCGLDLVQLHGAESPAFCLKVGAIASVIKVFCEEGGTWDPNPEDYRGSGLSYALVDSRRGARRGGTGIRVGHGPLQQFAQLGLAPLGVAGGLNPQNVGQVVREIAPALVDVSSGVEDQPGVKDSGKMEAFVRAARSAAEIT